MSMSIDVRSSDHMLVEPAQVAEVGPAAAASSVVDVLFPLVDDEEWPPYPAEMLDAVLIAHDLAEVHGVPWFVTNVSRGDIVKVRHDASATSAARSSCRGGHSTVHVMATSEDELAPIVASLDALGAVTAAAWCRRCSPSTFRKVAPWQRFSDVLSAANHSPAPTTVACEQHRPRAPRPAPILAPAFRADQLPQRG